MGQILDSPNLKSFADLAKELVKKQLNLVQIDGRPIANKNLVQSRPKTLGLQPSQPIP